MAPWRYDVAADGSVSNGRALVTYPGAAADVPDGLKVDAAGNIWASGPGGFRIIAPEGKVLGQIRLPESSPTWPSPTRARPPSLPDRPASFA